ncbi:diadenosine tetraphosphate (Ap4A) HIT family hydrolase [Rhizomicrobium palustre]|uniref:Diadenosine tetraphosphate (Ap4A) HIT family hydrolase n=1 Tax=Rhizomicrobium palustre TaxID=189966 RepID=A0A846N191_9PROT|nr:HIT family protein [Rhizomicrobium palustre]NIK89734.1 diadenosine tetraphosphate (Ap4A) HIT family hydrolase [Rhizomicrobium palustre]
MTEFFLDKRLSSNTVQALDLPVSRVLVMDDARFPWLVLVPRRPHLTEIFDVTPTDRVMLTEEVVLASEKLKALTGCHKINVANLGNVVPQLHIHVIARNPGDAAWPGPVWGQGAAVPYEPRALEAFVDAVVKMF